MLYVPHESKLRKICMFVWIPGIITLAVVEVANNLWYHNPDLGGSQMMIVFFLTVGALLLHGLMKLNQEIGSAF